jgi:hypothetical protein
MLHAFFWVIPRRLNFICRRFGTLCLFHRHRQVGMKNGWGWECWGIYTGKGLVSDWLRLFSSQTFSRINTPTFSTPVILHTYPPMKMEQTECSETLAYKIQTPGNYPEESVQYFLFVDLPFAWHCFSVLCSVSFHVTYCICFSWTQHIFRFQMNTMLFQISHPKVCLLNPNPLQILALDNSQRKGMQPKHPVPEWSGIYECTVWSTTASDSTVLREAKLKAIKVWKSSVSPQMSPIFVNRCVWAMTKYCVRHWWPCPGRTSHFFF